MELTRYFNMVRRWAWLLTLAVVIASVASYFVSLQIPPEYKALARLTVGPGVESPNPDLNALRAGGQLILTYTELATTRPMLQAVINEMHLDMSTDDLDSLVKVTSVPETQILSIRVTDGDPARAAAIANTLAGLLVKQNPNSATGSEVQLRAQMQSQIAGMQKTISDTEAQIKQLQADFQATAILDKQRLILDQISQQRAQLADAQRNLTTLYDLVERSVTNSIQVIEPATANTTPVPSPLTNNVMLAAAAGFILALIVVLVYEYFDNTVKSADEVVQVASVPFLGAIARHKALTGTGAERLAVQALPESRSADNYRMLGTRLYFNGGDSALHSVLVSSPQASNGTSEVAANLAVSLAQTGRKVVLVDANLRNPTLGQMFGLGEQRGLSDALNTNMTSPKLTKVDWLNTLSILPAGTSVANSFELLGSPSMVGLIQQLESQADLVIIAAAPLLASADSLVLASRVNGVVVVAQNGKTRRDAVRDAIESLRSVGANIVGTVLSSSRRGGVSLATAQPFTPRAVGQPVIEDADKKLSTV